MGFPSVLEQPLISVCSFVENVSRTLHTQAIDPLYLRLNIRKALREDVQIDLPIPDQIILPRVLRDSGSSRPV